MFSSLIVQLPYLVEVKKREEKRRNKYTSRHRMPISKSRFEQVEEKSRVKIVEQDDRGKSLMRDGIS